MHNRIYFVCTNFALFPTKFLTLNLYYYHPQFFQNFFRILMHICFLQNWITKQLEPWLGYFFIETLKWRKYTYLKGNQWTKSKLFFFCWRVRDRNIQWTFQHLAALVRQRPQNNRYPVGKSLFIISVNILLFVTAAGNRNCFRWNSLLMSGRKKLSTAQRRRTTTRLRFYSVGNLN